MNQRALLPEILSITSARAPATGVHEAALRERQEVAGSASSGRSGLLSLVQRGSSLEVSLPAVSFRQICMN